MKLTLPAVILFRKLFGRSERSSEPETFDLKVMFLMGRKELPEFKQDVKRFHIDSSETLYCGRHIMS